MGWCHEFGPQITEACEHPMEAGASSCTCTVCGVTCAGRFSGCGDVWARGPRRVMVSVPPRRPAAAILRDLDPAPSEENQPNFDLDLTTGPARPAAAVLDELARRVEELESQADQKAAVREPSLGVGGGDSSVLESLADRLDRLGVEVSALAELPERLTALEQSRGSSAPGLAEKAVVVMSQRLDRLTAQMAEVEAVAGEAVAGEAVAGEPRPDEERPDEEGPAASEAKARSERLSALAGELESLPVRMQALETMPERLAALEEQAAGALDGGDGGDGGVVAKGLAEAESRLEQIASDVTTLQPVVARVAALERVQGRLADLETVVESLGGSVQELSHQVASMRDLPHHVEALGRLPERMAAFDKVLFGLIKGMERISADAGTVTDVVRRVSALEEAEGPDKLLASFGRRIDRLSTQAAAVKDVPARLDILGGETAALSAAIQELPRHDHVAEEVAEEVATRTSSLARGLGGAIDMIDQLSAQVAALEQVVAGARPTASVPGAPAAASIPSE